MSLQLQYGETLQFNRMHLLKDSVFLYETSNSFQNHFGQTQKEEGHSENKVVFHCSSKKDVAIRDQRLSTVTNSIVNVGDVCQPSKDKKSNSKKK